MLEGFGHVAPILQASIFENLMGESYIVGVKPELDQEFILGEYTTSFIRCITDNHLDQRLWAVARASIWATRNRGSQSLVYQGTQSSEVLEKYYEED